MVSNSKKNISDSSLVFPLPINEEIENKLSFLTNELVKHWGDRQLSVLELDDRMATAKEAPTDDNLIKLLKNPIRCKRI